MTDCEGRRPRNECGVEVTLKTLERLMGED
jgi:hypothetical protein